jgi:hypothetical protein
VRFAALFFQRARDWLLDQAITAGFGIIDIDRLAPPRETPIDRAIPQEGERLRNALPWLGERRGERASPRRPNLPSSHAIASVIGRLLSSNSGRRSSPSSPEEQELPQSGRSQHPSECIGWIDYIGNSYVADWAPLAVREQG